MRESYGCAELRTQNILNMLHHKKFKTKLHYGAIIVTFHLMSI